ncbi:MAG TPA: hypothetical protein VF748_14970 [Candidatus Acidoferrum sp.]
MGIMAGIGGLVGGLSGLFGGGTNQPQAPNVYQLQNMPGADTGAFGGIGNLSGYTGGLTGATTGPALNTFQNLYNNPGAGGLLSGANVAGGLGQNAALTGYGVGGNLINTGINTLPGIAGNVLNTSMDPQQALYNRTLQQTQDQSRAGLEARGLDMTPYGAGVEGQTLSNFNIDWQNQQLLRQIQGAQTAGGLLTQGGNLANLGTGIQNTAPGQYLSASGLPYGAYSTVGGGQNAAINSLLGIGTSGANLQNLPISDYLSYLQTGNQSNQVANQNYGLQLQAQNQQFNEQMKLGSLLGGSIYGLGQSPFGQYGLGGSSPFGYNPNAFGGSGSLFGYSLSPTFGFG